MNQKVLGGVLLGLGIVLILVGILLMAVIVPGMKKFPDDVNTDRVYQSVQLEPAGGELGALNPGIMPVLLSQVETTNEEGETTTSLEFLRDFPVTIERHFETVATDGDVALVYEIKLIKGIIERDAQGEIVQDAEPVELKRVIYHYLIDRKSMNHLEGEKYEKYAEKWATKVEEGGGGLWERKGIVLGWPIDTEKKDYDGWSEDYNDSVLLKYEGKEKHPRANMDTYLFTASSGPLLVDDRAVENMGLPLALPANVLVPLLMQAASASESELSPEISAKLGTIITALNAYEGPIPLEYYYEYEGWYWIEPTSGVLIDTKKHELRKAGLPASILGSEEIGLTEEQQAELRATVYDLTYQASDGSVSDAKKDAEDAIDKINLYGTYLPIVAIIAGIVLGGVGAFLMLRKQSSATA